jgi:phosphatidylethanolamine/phosphatidyl-N-methylethanolamine N-methyltransferase
MPQRHARRRPDSEPPLGDETTFLRRFFGNPKLTGAVAPSSPWLAREMARAIDPARRGLVIELGPGTGPVTKALIARGVGRDRLMLVEYDAHFCRLLAERFPLTQVVQGDAYDLAATLKGAVKGPVAAVVSSLPLLNQPPAQRLKLLRDAFELMGPDGVFVQFTYGVKSPMPRETLAGEFVGRSGPTILRNLPPASVWIYRRHGHSGPMRPKMNFVDRAELLGRQFNAKRKAAEVVLTRHRDRVKAVLAREAAAFRHRRHDRDRRP